MDKKRRFFCLGMILLLGASLLLGGAITEDESLILAKVNARQIFEIDENDTSHTFKASFLNGLDDMPDYILVTKNEIGYAIFHRETMQLIEYSSESSSPYQNRKTDIYYGGPANYYAKNKEAISHIYTMEQVDKADVSTIANEVKNKIEEPNKSSRLESDASISSSPPIDLEPVDPNKYYVVNRKYISDYKYFLYDPHHGENDTKTCTTVATQLLLGYNHWAKDGRLITNNDFLYNRVAGNTNLEKPHHRDTISTSLALYEYLLQYIDPDEDGASLADAYKGIRSYLTNYVSLDVRQQISYGYSNIASTAKTQIKAHIDANRPALASIDTYKHKEDGSYEISGHMVVAYGYQTFRVNGVDLEGYIAHYGWKEEHNNVWFNASWLTGYLYFSTEHNHEDTEIGGPYHIIQCGVCNRRSTTDTHVYTQYYQTYIDPTNTATDPVWHTAICDCEYQNQERHEFMYKKSTYSTHKMICRKCFYTIEAAHFYKRSDSCMNCGFTPN